MNYTLEQQIYEVRMIDGTSFDVKADDYKLEHGWYLFFVNGKVTKRIPAAYVDKVVCDD